MSRFQDLREEVGSGLQGPREEAGPRLQGLREEAGADWVRFRGAHLPGPTDLPPEGMCGWFGELVQVTAELASWKECTQLRVHVAENQRQLGQLPPAG